MKKVLSIATLLMLISAIFVSCSNDDGDDSPSNTNFRKLDQVMAGSDLQSVTLETDLTWSENQLTKIEAYDDDAVNNRNEITYTNASSSTISEINIYSTDDERKTISCNLNSMLNKYFVHYLGLKSSELELNMKLKPIYTNGKITKIEIYGNPEIKTLDYYGYLSIEYTNGNQTKASMIISSELFNIEIMNMHAKWENGNIVAFYTKIIDVENNKFTTLDSTVYKYDNKVNAYGSLKIYPMFEAQTSSNNNITKELSYMKSDMSGRLLLYNTINYTYTYDGQNYPVSSVVSKTFGTITDTWVQKFEYK
ncbi:MAG: hypothetical protein PHU27_11005 [Salinivirgaceae bacterium]|nr:hypothetical protein [Salinivirgaceae bacterium]